MATNFGKMFDNLWPTTIKAYSTSDATGNDPDNTVEIPSGGTITVSSDNIYKNATWIVDDTTTSNSPLLWVNNTFAPQEIKLKLDANEVDKAFQDFTKRVRSFLDGLQTDDPDIAPLLTVLRTEYNLAVEELVSKLDQQSEWISSHEKSGEGFYTL